jgi:hypothetical protein
MVDRPDPDFKRMIALTMFSSWLSRFLGLDCYQCQESSGLSLAEHDAWNSGDCPDGGYVPTIRMTLVQC